MPQAYPSGSAALRVPPFFENREATDRIVKPFDDDAHPDVCLLQDQDVRRTRRMRSSDRTFASLGKSSASEVLPLLVYLIERNIRCSHAIGSEAILCS